MPKAFTPQEKEWIGKRLLEQGYKQFSAYGLRKTNVEELAEAAGISKGAFYLFYESKEALFMDVAEQAEERFRQEVLAAIDLPGLSPRARMFAVLKKAFTLWKEIPILQFFTRSDYDLIMRRVSPEIIHEHLSNDRKFIEVLIRRCQESGIPIRASADQIGSLLYALFLTSLHEDDLGPNNFSGTVDLLMELVAAFYLGEVSIQVEHPLHPASQPEKDIENGFND